MKEPKYRDAYYQTSSVFITDDPDLSFRESIWPQVVIFLLVVLGLVLLYALVIAPYMKPVVHV